QTARTRWKNGSHRKLQRKRPAVGVMHRRSTTKSNMSSHLICLTSFCPCLTTPAIRAAGATKPPTHNAALCGRVREEKSIQFAVHDGRTSPGSAAGGTRHCQCAADDCNSRAEP